MASFDISRYITIGQYLPTGSPIHRMDPRYKLLSFILIVLATTYVSSYTGTTVMFLLSILLLVLARIPIRYGLSGIIPTIPILVIMFVLTAVLYQAGPGTTTVFQIGFARVTAEGLRLAVVSTIRFIEVVFLVSVYTLSTTLSDVTHSVERILSPLRHIRFPVHETALIVTIALRFVPTFAKEAEKLMKAQASRGGAFGTTRWWQIIKRTRSVFPIILPLFLSAMRRADELVFAMEARGYAPGAPRTSFIEFDSRIVDRMYLFLVIIVYGAIAWFLK